jgi:hypothetical protein
MVHFPKKFERSQVIYHCHGVFFAKHEKTRKKDTTNLSQGSGAVLENSGPPRYRMNSKLLNYQKKRDLIRKIRYTEPSLKVSAGYTGA